VNEDSISICQYFGLTAECGLAAGSVLLNIDIETLSGMNRSSSVAADSNTGEPITAKVPDNPHVVAFRIRMEKTNGSGFSLRIRAPWWLKGEPKIELNGQRLEPLTAEGFMTVEREWKDEDELYVELPRGLHCWKMPDAPDMVAFMDGPVVLAGLVDEERLLCGDATKPETMLRGDNEREWGMWYDTYHTLNLDRGFRFIPLYSVGYEPYTVYFPIRPN
jgi:hypothetical protein